MNYKKVLGLEPGDRIIEPLFQTGFSKHHAIYLVTINNTDELIAENHKFKGVQLIKASDYFASVKSIDRIIKFQGDASQRYNALERAVGLKGRRYDLVNYNCEHYANEVQNGAPISHQVRNAFLIFLAVLAFLIALQWK
ncbi:hypothetical protein OQY15_09740 [Pedobacter sp. MC2016-15]|uniref:hypothetical protein n=1 Tax=Pedobacter sp. MC2016-15 TaxID=2994473 RepID=UPI002246733F|nr:hypothetical protein [Pedobacter sp. MC2016-15]MCX2479371.1 hypothetical protein [Pedobacter sp. MC2016-15]